MRRRTYSRRTPTTDNAGRRAPIVRHYASIGEIIAAADAQSSHYPESGASWTYGNDWTDEPTTRAGLMNGDAPASALAAYEEVSRTMDAARLAASEQAAPTRRRRQVWADQGDEIDPDRLNTGHANPWRTTRVGKTAPIVRLALNIGLSSSNSGEGFAKVAAHAAAIADALTLAGYSVEIIGTVATQNREGSSTVYTFPLKQADEPLDAKRILSAAAPGLLRAYLLDQLREDNGEAGGGYARLPHDLAEIIGTPHVIARHWENGREIDANKQAARIIAASQAHAAA